MSRAGRGPARQASLTPAAPVPKRRRVRRACAVCNRRKVSCSNDRPCTRCIKDGCVDECIDVVPGINSKSRSKFPDTPPLPAGAAEDDDPFEAALAVIVPPLPQQVKLFESGPGLSDTNISSLEALFAANLTSTGMPMEELARFAHPGSSSIVSAGSCFDPDLDLVINSALWASPVPVVKKHCCADAFGPGKAAVFMSRSAYKMFGYYPQLMDLLCRRGLPSMWVHPLYMQDRMAVEANAMATRAPLASWDGVFTHVQYNVPMGHITYTPFRATEVMHFTYNTSSPPRIVCVASYYTNYTPPYIKPPEVHPSASTLPVLGTSSEYLSPSTLPAAKEPLQTLSTLDMRCPYGLPHEPLPKDPMVDQVPPTYIGNMATIMSFCFMHPIKERLVEQFSAAEDPLLPQTVKFEPAATCPAAMRTTRGGYLILDLAEEVSAGTASFQYAPELCARLTASQPERQYGLGLDRGGAGHLANSPWSFGPIPAQHDILAHVPDAQKGGPTAAIPATLAMSSVAEKFAADAASSGSEATASHTTPHPSFADKMKGMVAESRLAESPDAHPIHKVPTLPSPRALPGVSFLGRHQPDGPAPAVTPAPLDDLPASGAGLDDLLGAAPFDWGDLLALDSLDIEAL